MKELKLINPNKQELTIDKLRELIHDCNYTDEELKNIVFTIRMLVHIIIQYQILIISY